MFSFLLAWKLTMWHRFDTETFCWTYFGRIVSAHCCSLGFRHRFAAQGASVRCTTAFTGVLKSAAAHICAAHSCIKRFFILHLLEMPCYRPDLLASFLRFLPLLRNWVRVSVMKSGKNFCLLKVRQVLGELCTTWDLRLSQAFDSALL